MLCDVHTRRFADSVMETRRTLDRCRCASRAMKERLMNEVKRRGDALVVIVRAYEKELIKVCISVVYL